MKNTESLPLNEASRTWMDFRLLPLYHYLSPKGCATGAASGVPVRYLILSACDRNPVIMELDPFLWESASIRCHKMPFSHFTCSFTDCFVLSSPLLSDRNSRFADMFMLLLQVTSPGLQPALGHNLPHTRAAHVGPGGSM